MSKEKVLVAMSGGVDSSVAAALLLEQGYEVEGVTMQIWPDTDLDPAEGGCCSLSAVEDARRVANRLGIRYHVFNFKDLFSQTVIEPFVQEYRRGRTPNPCILCNQKVKFEALLQRALVLGFDYLATGHYARVVPGSDGLQHLYCAPGGKDQTYALYRINQEQLSHLLLPVGDFPKPQIREIAREKGLPVFNKPDSQEICFVKDNDYAGLIAGLGYSIESGDFVDTQGNVLGRHRGIEHYTVGQRKGLGMSFGEPKFVLSIDAQKKQVVLGSNEELMQRQLIAEDVCFLSGQTPTEPLVCQGKVRYSAPTENAVVTMQEDGCAFVEFERPVRAITPGQAVVFYDGDEVLGGGVICGVPKGSGEKE